MAMLRQIHSNAQPFQDAFADAVIAAAFFGRNLAHSAALAPSNKKNGCSRFAVRYSPRRLRQERIDYWVESVMAMLRQPSVGQWQFPSHQRV
jgi:hypothetical protein